MKRTLLFFSLLLVCVCCSTAFAQDDFFEGVVRYRHFIEIKDTLANEWEVTALYGEGGNFYINKEGRYRIEPRGTSIEWQIYDPQQARLYFKFIKRDTVYWHAATMPTEEVVEVYPVKEEKDYLLGYTCHLLMMKVKTVGSSPEVLGKMYFFAPELKVNAAAFARHHTNSQDRVFAITQSIPLRIVVLQRHYRVIIEAEDVEPRALPADLFRIPADLPQKELQFN
ncbi:MAG: hypothetical protein KatS3mg033_0515 [Thermonema sp.]|uniref:hypothetical protein n=1 Tax=Thermonema TaxID=28194 RepID=UPI00056FE817|nr:MULTISPECIES: hypothetical protein [Thermonema]GIV38715.1 MAG: hypothetical protein KatS3mg033_0515 [Thermonema sp.]